jgi:hypothetical protein
MFSNIDESVRRLPRRPAWQRSASGSRKSARAVSSGGRHLGLGKAGSIDVLRTERAQAASKRVAPAALPASRSKRGVRGFLSTEPLLGRQGSSALFRPRESAPGR